MADGLLMATVRSHDPPLRWPKRIQGLDVKMGAWEWWAEPWFFTTAVKTHPSAISHNPY